MQLNLSTDIALRTLIYLGQKGAPATIAEVARSFDIAKNHLMKVVMALAAADLIISERGRNGGIRLARTASEIRLGEVVQLMENSLALVFCMKEGTSNDDCPLLPSCRLRKLFFKAQKSLLASLDESTLADLLPVKINLNK